MLFGYPLEPDFDFAKEKRRDRVGWALYGGTVLAIAYELGGGHFGVEVFQAVAATVLFYGVYFYADRRRDLGKLWLWKVVLATVPLHAVYLAALFWSDRELPGMMTKAIVFMPVVAVAFVFESILTDRLIDFSRAGGADVKR